MVDRPPWAILREHDVHQTPKIGAPMRILKGKHAGRHLTSPGGDVRPTPEDVRDRCASLVEDDLRGAAVLDLFAGSGALGLEALSRGARSVDFVENGASALHALKANVAALRATKSCRIFKRDALPWIEGLARGAYGVAFVDPPYGSRKLDRVVERWLRVPFADVLVLEHAKDHEVAAKGKRYDFEGPTRVTVLRARRRRADRPRTGPASGREDREPSPSRPTGGPEADGGDRPTRPADRPPTAPERAKAQKERLTRTKKFRPGR
jgi:16S rRNA (guanine966-N2)-methyltransferase